MMSIPLYLRYEEFLSNVNFKPLFSYAVMVGLDTPNISATLDRPYLSFGLHPLFTGFCIFPEFKN